MGTGRNLAKKLKNFVGFFGDMGPLHCISGDKSGLRIIKTGLYRLRVNIVTFQIFNFILV
jgi:hypothetical protein